MPDNPAQVTIRAAGRDDLPAVMQLMAQLNPDDAAPDPEAAAAIWQAILDDPRTTYLVAERAGRIVGTCCLAIVPNLTRGLRPFAVIENVVVDGAARRGGVATALLDRARALSVEANCYKVMLMSNRKRSEAHGLYRKAGFESETKLAFDQRL